MIKLLKGVKWGTTIGAIKGDTRSLDYSSYIPQKVKRLCTQLRRNPGSSQSASPK